MACNMTSITVSFPRPGATAQVTCPAPGSPGKLPYTSGSANATCKALQSRAQVNGAGWVYGSANSASPTGGPPYMIAWAVSNVSSVSCAGSNQLKVEIQLSDGSWHAANPVNFSAYCSAMPVPMHLATADILYEVIKITPPWDPWGLKEGKLLSTEVVALQRVQSAEIEVPPVIEWRSIGAAAELWRLKMTGPKQAELRLRLPFISGNQSVVIEQLWGCGKFDPQQGGLFAPVDNIFVPHYVEISDTHPPVAMMAMASSQRKTTAKKSSGKVKRGAKKAPKAKPKGRGKAKARRKAKKGRGRGR